MNMRSTIQHIQHELDDREAIERCARQCGVLGDVTKLKICYLLCHHDELSVSTIAGLVGASVSNVSHSLSRLRAADMVKARKESRTVYYSLDIDGLTNEARRLLAV